VPVIPEEAKNQKPKPHAMYSNLQCSIIARQSLAQTCHTNIELYNFGPVSISATTTFSMKVAQGRAKIINGF
jgi:hypothetical protein